MRLASIHVYPLKSGAGLAPERWPLVAGGLRGDRQLMLVDPDGNYVTLRGCPRIVTVRAALETDGTVRFAAPDAGEVLIADGASSAEPWPIQIWGEHHPATLVSPEADAWFTEVVRRPVRLVRFLSSVQRQVDPRYAREGDTTFFSDGFPLLVTATASLRALSERFGRPVEMARFRPNLVIETDEPFVEDTWRELRIGDLRIDIVKPCARCVAVNVEPVTGRTAKEPLATLAQLRTRDGKVWFGQNAIHRGVGTLTVGDAVTVVASDG